MGFVSKCRQILLSADEIYQLGVVVETSQIEQGDLVVVYWFDTIEEPAWTKIPLIQVQRDVLCKSVGWFLSQDTDCIRLLTSITGKDIDSADAGYILISQKAIKNIEKIRDDEIEVE